LPWVEHTFESRDRQVENQETGLQEPPADVRLLDAPGFAPLVEAAAEIYGAAMNRSPATVTSRRDLMRTHLDRPGFVAVSATRAEQLVGFGYGYRGAPGQWWHDVVATALGRDQAHSWLAGAFELAELHVAPAHQGQGIGRRLIDRLLAGADASIVVLSTPDARTPARGLYRSLGFTDLLSGFRFPGSSELYAVMGLRR
jgi:ribosomal protein S18 acetylase RimI-like enzyme